MKRALITGASSPIGQSVARHLAEQGRSLILHANSNAEAVESLAVELQTGGTPAQTLIADLTDPKVMPVLQALAEEDPVQIVVLNAGLHRDIPFAAMKAEDWRDVIDVNLTGVFTALRPLILPMMRTRWGRIVAISSLTAVTGNRGQTNYAAAKGGLLPLMKSLTREYGARGITANVVAPGVIATPDTQSLANYNELVKLSPAGRAGKVEEVASLVGFLASDHAGYISGQLIAVDGGTT
ncbi:MAG: SDR family NAD(P)-dependent oxidoreductase [Pseudomonadota bacterium]